MPRHPLIEDAIQATGLRADQVEGALGLVVTHLRERLSPEEFRHLQSVLPEIASWTAPLPRPGKGLLGHLAGALGGDSARRLLDLSQGLSRLGIPQSKQKALARALADSVQCHYPELQPLFEKEWG